MISKVKIALLLVLIAVLVLPGTALARGLENDKVVAGGSYTLGSGETLDGNLIVFGGSAILEVGSQVNGNVVLMGGSVNIDGKVNGDVVGIGGSVDLGSSAVITGDLTTIGASLDRTPGARVEGQVITGFQGPLQFTFPDRIELPKTPFVEVRVPPALGVLWFFFRTFLWGALAVLLVMFLPKPTDRVSQMIVGQPLLAGGVGLLTAVVAPVLMIGIAITIILIPVSLFAALVLALAWFFGRIALGTEVGRRFGEMFKQDWPLAVSAGVGTFILSLVVDGVNALIPCVGWLAPVLVGILGLGGVLLTRFGTQSYPPPERVVSSNMAVSSQKSPNASTDQADEGS